MCNFKLISLLIVLAKSLKKNVSKYKIQLTNYLNEHQIINEIQYGFKVEEIPQILCLTRQNMSRERLI